MAEKKQCEHELPIIDVITGVEFYDISPEGAAEFAELIFDPNPALENPKGVKSITFAGLDESGNHTVIYDVNTQNISYYGPEISSLRPTAKAIAGEVARVHATTSGLVTDYEQEKAVVGQAEANVDKFWWDTIAGKFARNS